MRCRVRVGWILLSLSPLWLMAEGCYLSHGRRSDAAVPGELDGGLPPLRDAGPDAPPIPCRLERMTEVTLRDPGTHAAQAPDAVWTGSELAVAMMEGGGDTSHPVVTMVTASANLSEVSRPRTIGEESHGWGEIEAAGGAITLCWHGDPGGDGRTMIRQVLDGAELGPRRDHDPEGEACLDLVASADHLLVAWRHPVGTGGDTMIETRAQVVLLDGEPIGEPLVLARGPYPGRSVALAATTETFFAAVSPEDGTLRVLEISAVGDVLREQELIGPDLRGASIAADGERVALLIGRGPPEVRALDVLVLDRRLAPMGTPRTLADGAPTATSGSIHTGPAGWVVTWVEGYRPGTALTMLRLDRAGNAQEPRVRAFTGTNSGYGGPALARNGNELYLAFSATPGDSYDRLLAQHWACVASAVDVCAPQEAFDGLCHGGEPVMWRWDGSDCVPLQCWSSCGGPDCDRVASSRFGCLSDHAVCMRSSCEGTTEPAPIGRACADSVSVRAGDAVRVNVERTMECPCGASLSCSVSVAEPFVLALETTMCRPPIDCDCAPGIPETLRASCDLPPLSAGTWTVRGDGVEPLTITVVEPWEMPTPEAACSGE